MIKLTKFNASDIASQLDDPFSMTNITYVGDMVVSIYICQGTLQWHRHTDIDEMFWVHEGRMTLESERGTVELQPGELTIVPKGIEHRSSSRQRASVLLLRCGFLPHRKNGKRKLYATGDDVHLKRVSLHDAAMNITQARQFETIAWIEDSIVQVGWGEGQWPIQNPLSEDELIFVLDGTATVRTIGSMVHLHYGDFTVVPRGAFYELLSSHNTILARVKRSR